MVAIVSSNSTSNCFQYACHIVPLAGPRSSLCFRFTQRTPDVIEIVEEHLQKRHVFSMLRLCRAMNGRNTMCRLSGRCIRLFSTATSPEIFCWRCDTRSASTSFCRRPASSLVLRALPVHLAHVKTIMLMELRLRVAFSIPCLPSLLRLRGHRRWWW